MPRPPRADEAGGLYHTLHWIKGVRPNCPLCIFATAGIDPGGMKRVAWLLKNQPFAGLELISKKRTESTEFTEMFDRVIECA